MGHIGAELILPLLSREGHGNLAMEILMQKDHPSWSYWLTQGATEANLHVGYGPDLCIIGFGMNDGTKLYALEFYRRNIQTIIDTARAANPNCEFVLIATMLANPEVGDFAFGAGNLPEDRVY